jgi:hypothetical protein
VLASTLGEAKAMCLRALMRAARERKRRAEPIEVARPPPATGPSSIEYRESHRGFLLRASANGAGRYSLFIEDPQGPEPGYARTLSEIDKRFPSDGFANLIDAIDAVPAAKAAVDACLERRRAS